MSQNTPDQPKNPDNIEGGLRFNGSVRPIQEDDVVALRTILEEWVRHNETKGLIENEISSFLTHMRATSLGEGVRSYVVAETLDGRVVGVMGLAPVGEGLRQHTQSERPIEVVNAFVTDSERGGGAGRELLDSLESLAIKQGYTELIVTSGPRYKEKGWPFWTKTFGPPTAIIKDAYGPGNDGPVWRKSLTVL